MTTLNDFQVDPSKKVLSAQYNMLLGTLLRSEVSNKTIMAGTLQLTNSDTPIQQIDNNGANRTVLLPAFNIANHPFFIINATASGTAYTTDVQSASGTSLLSSPLTVGQSTLVIPDGLQGYLVAGGSSALDVQDEGVSQGLASHINFTGQNVIASVSGSTANVAVGGTAIIQDILLTGTATNFNFTSIPSSFTDLTIDLYLRSNKAAATFDTINLTINGVTGTSYDFLAWQSYHSATVYTVEGLGVVASANGIIYATAASTPSGYFSIYTVTIPNYAQTVGYKTYQIRGVAPLTNTGGQERLYDGHGVFKSASAINALKFWSPADSFIAGSRATLRGRP